MRSTAIRPNLNEVDEYQLNVDGYMLRHVEQGLLYQISLIEESVDNHNACDPHSDIGCRVMAAWIDSEYSSPDAAAKDGYFLSDCSGSFTHHYSELSKLYDLLHQIRYMRRHPQTKGLTAEQEMQDKAAEVVLAAERERAEMEAIEAGEKAAAKSVLQDSSPLAESDLERIRDGLVNLPATTGAPAETTTSTPNGNGKPPPKRKGNGQEIAAALEKKRESLLGLTVEAKVVEAAAIK